MERKSIEKEIPKRIYLVSGIQQIIGLFYLFGMIGAWIEIKEPVVLDYSSAVEFARERGFLGFTMLTLGTGLHYRRSWARLGSMIFAPLVLTSLSGGVILILIRLFTMPRLLLDDPILQCLGSIALPVLAIAWYLLYFLFFNQVKVKDFFRE